MKGSTQGWSKTIFSTRMWHGACSSQPALHKAKWLESIKERMHWQLMIWGIILKKTELNWIITEIHRPHAFSTVIVRKILEICEYVWSTTLVMIWLNWWLHSTLCTRCIGLLDRKPAVPCDTLSEPIYQMHMALEDKHKITFICLESFYPFKRVTQDFHSPS